MTKLCRGAELVRQDFRYRCTATGLADDFSVARPRITLQVTQIDTPNPVEEPGVKQPGGWIDKGVDPEKLAADYRIGLTGGQYPAHSSQGRGPARTTALASIPRRKRQRRGFQTTTAVLLGTTAMSRR